MNVIKLFNIQWIPKGYYINDDIDYDIRGCVIDNKQCDCKDKNKCICCKKVIFFNNKNYQDTSCIYSYTLNVLNYELFGEKNKAQYYDNILSKGKIMSVTAYNNKIVVLACINNKIKIWCWIHGHDIVYSIKRLIRNKIDKKQYHCKDTNCPCANYIVKRDKEIEIVDDLLDYLEVELNGYNIKCIMVINSMLICAFSSNSSVILVQLKLEVHKGRLVVEKIKRKVQYNIKNLDNCYFDSLTNDIVLITSCGSFNKIKWYNHLETFSQNINCNKKYNKMISCIAPFNDKLMIILNKSNCYEIVSHI